MHKVERRVVFAGGIGSILEMYDFSLYAFFAPLLGELFFPSEKKITSLLATFSVFALGYLMRPFGGAIFGNLGDKYGRKRILILAVILMGVPTFLIGCLPTVQQVGPFAGLLLILVRLIQGFAVGSEFAGATIFMAEHAEIKNRGFMCSWIIFSIQLGLLVGSAVGTLVTASFSSDFLRAWGWRLPFWAGILIIPIALYIRRNV